MSGGVNACDNQQYQHYYLPQIKKTHKYSIILYIIKEIFNSSNKKTKSLI